MTLPKRDSDGRDPAARVDRWRPRALAVWTVVGAFVAGWLVIGALSYVEQALELLLVGGVIGFVCSPVTNRLEDAGLPRGLAALVALVAFLVALVALLGFVGGPLLQELLALLRNVPAYVTQVNDGLAAFWAKVGTSDNSNVQNVVNSVVSAASSMGSSMASDLARRVSGGLAANITAMVSDFTTFFLGIILAYWFALDYPRMVRELVRVVGPERGGDVTLVLAVLSRSTGGYMRGTLITSIANGLMVAAGLVLVGHPYAGLVGSLTFVMHFIPVIGPMLSAVAGTALGLFVSPVCALWTLVIAVIAQNVADNVLSPMVMRSAVKIHPALSLVGIIVGGCLGGPVGMVIAVPLTAALRGFFVYFFETRTGRQIVSEDGALFGGRPHVDGGGRPVPALDALDDERFFEGSRLAVAPVAGQGDASVEKGAPAEKGAPGEKDAPRGGEDGGRP